MAPGDDTGASIVVIGLLDHISNLLIGLASYLIDHRIGKLLGQLRCHFLSTLSNGFQNLRTIEKLTADHKPKHIILHYDFSFLLFIDLP